LIQQNHISQLQFTIKRKARGTGGTNWLEGSDNVILLEKKLFNKVFILLSIWISIYLNLATSRFKKNRVDFREVIFKYRVEVDFKHLRCK
jgi:hypothetical protein